MMDGGQVDTYGLPVNTDISFTTHKNKPHKGTMNRQLKTLRDFAPILKQLLKPDETAGCESQFSNVLV